MKLNPRYRAPGAFERVFKNNVYQHYLKWVLRLKYFLSALFLGTTQSAFCSYHTPEREEEEEKKEVRTSGLCAAENE